MSKTDIVNALETSTQSRKRGRIGLKSFLLIVTAVCIGTMGYLYVRERARQTRIDDWVNEHGGKASYDFQINSDGTISDAMAPTPTLVERFFAGLQHSNIVDIYLSSSNIVDIEPLRGLSRLEKLDVSNVQAILDLQPLSGNQRLWFLSLTHTDVVSLNPLSSTKGLRYLSLYGTQVDDVKALNTLVDLRYLSLANTRVSDVVPLVDLKGLEELFLQGTPVADIRPLGQLTELRSLSLAQTKVTDVSPLLNLSKLRELWLNGTSLTDDRVESLKRQLPKCEIFF